LHDVIPGSTQVVEAWNDAADAFEQTRLVPTSA